MFGLNTYYKRKKLKIDMELHSYRTELMNGIQELAMECAKQRGEYEHEWHSKQEELNTSIAKIEASKESMTKDLDNLKVIIKEKDAEIERLHKICIEFSKNNRNERKGH